MSKLPSDSLSSSGLVNTLDRRDLLKILSTVPLAGLLSTPAYRAAAATVAEDITIQTVGGRTIGASVFRPQTVHAALTKVPTVLLFHEWWGLNDQIKTVAADLAAKHGYAAIALDLYDGKTATAPDQAMQLVKGINHAAAIETSIAWATWAKSQPFANGQVATMGWCLGGGWSLETSCSTPIDATVIYYGNVARSADQLKTLKGPVLGHFATLDGHINKPMVDGFEKAMAEAGKSLDLYWYEADHAFANPTSAKYDEPNAALSWERTVAFLKKNLAV